MRLLHRQTIQMLPGPFVGWLGLLMFLLVMQFLIRYLPDIAGKGLPVGVIVELVAYNLAYMAVLAVPMSVLLASLMTYGRLAESNAYAVMKGAGISLPQLIGPSLVVGLVATLAMTYFNNQVLPEANYRARTLWKDIRKKKPGFDLQPGVFYNGLDGYSILVGDQDTDTNELFDITIYDYNAGGREQIVVKARRGAMRPDSTGTSLDLILTEGEMHRPRPATTPSQPDRYEVLAFSRHRLTLQLDDFTFERTDTDGRDYRSDRTMPTTAMVHMVDSLERSIAIKQSEIQERLLGLAADSTLYRQTPEGEDAAPSLPAARTVAFQQEDGVGRASPLDHPAVASLDSTQQRRVLLHALEAARTTRAEAENLERALVWEAQRADRYRVEIHKKFSIAVACLIFMLIGAPLGLSVRRGGLGVVGGLALGIFMFYWITLVQGEKLADRGLLEPWVGMWAANMVMLVVALWLVLYVSFDLRATWRFRSKLPGVGRPAEPEGASAPTVESTA